MSNGHFQDAGYKLLFSHPRTVADLLRGFVREEWVEALDLTTLERVNASFVSDDLRARHDDVIWRVRLRERWLYLYLLIEFQSSPDPWMALRLLVYIGLLYQDLIKGGEVKAGERLPPVFPVVLYNGRAPWRAALELAELIEPVPPPLSGYQPKQCYWLLEERAVDIQDLGDDNAMAHILRLEQSRYPAELRQAVARLNKTLQQPAYTSLRRAFTVWINRVVLRRLLPGQEIPEIQDLVEVETMLAEQVEEWTEQWKQQGLQEGLEQGRLAGARDSLKKFLEVRFGPLPPWARETLESLATSEEALDVLIRSAAAAPSLEMALRLPEGTAPDQGGCP